MLPNYTLSSLFELLYYAFVLVLALPARSAAQTTKTTNSLRNLTIPLDSPLIIYTPFRCDSNDTQSSPGACNGAWSTVQVDDNTTITTRGPDPATGEIVPQMFLQFRGSALFLETSPTSNAQVNITITTNSTTLSAVFDSNLHSASILNLVQSSTSTFSLTFLPSVGAITTPREFGLASMIITVLNDTPTSSFLPTMTLPPSSSPPIFTPPSTTARATSSLSVALPIPTDPNANASSSTSSLSARRTNIALAVGITIGLGLGLTAVAVVVYCIWKKKRRPRWVSGSAVRRGSGPVASTAATRAADGSVRRGGDSRVGNHLGSASRFGSQRPTPVAPGWRNDYI